ncbi:MAG: 2-hydroxychromene-2-carboxylate isomerase [Beijerinckiaceae bacterium]|nr:2-hydroxychromene-2-carboxylate isomerase [Beijerinckiaceae bacterium]
MSLEIVHYFAPMSGYAYLGAAALARMAERHGCVVRHAPVDIQAVFAASGVTPPAVQSAAKKAYRRADMRRWADLRGLPLRETPKHWPAPGALAARYILAAERLAARGGEMSNAVLAACWARDLDIADETVLSGLAREIGVDPQDIAACAHDDVTAQEAAGVTNDAIRLGLFGSPTYVLGEDIFFGQDRLDFLERELIRLRSGTEIARA